ncbi:MAG: tetratricopeptide repeat protein [Geminicoccaceae bacterium]
MSGVAARDEAMAAWWYGRAAAAKPHDAQFNLAAPRTRQGVPRDETEAVRLLELAAAQDYAPAMNELGVHYDGSPFEADHVTAVGWFRRAAKLDNPFAQVDLAGAYEKGGVCCPTSRRPGTGTAGRRDARGRRQSRRGGGRSPAHKRHARPRHPTSISFEWTEQQVGDSYEVPADHRLGILRGEEGLQEALFGLNLALRAMLDEGEMAEDS